MRRTNHREERGTGMSAALKAMAVVIAVGMLALVAEQSFDASRAGSVATPTYQRIEPAPDDAPYIGADTQATDRIENGGQHMLAAAPADVSVPKMQVQESSRPTDSSAQREEPVATF